MKLGFKVKTRRLSGAATPCYSQLSNVANVQTFTNQDNTSCTPPMQFAKYRTFGLEVEGNYITTNYL